MTYSTQASASSAAGKVIQIASAENRLYALTEDGEIWLYDGYDLGWEQLPHPSQGRLRYLSSAIGRKNPPTHHRTPRLISAVFKGPLRLICPRRLSGPPLSERTNENSRIIGLQGLRGSSILREDYYSGKFRFCKRREISTKRLGLRKNVLPRRTSRTATHPTGRGRIKQSSMRKRPSSVGRNKPNRPMPRRGRFRLTR